MTLFDDDFLDEALRRVRRIGIVSGSDGAFHYALLDADIYRLTVIDARESIRMTGAVGALAHTPAAVMNAQFISLKGKAEGDVIRAGRVLQRDSRPARYFVAEDPSRSGMRRFVLGRGNPSVVVPRATSGIGGLGPVLDEGRTVPRDRWSDSIYERDRQVGRGVIAVDRGRRLIIFLAQEDRSVPWAETGNTRKLSVVRSWLKDMRVADAIFNDGSDSEALAVNGRWLIEPAVAKDVAMEYALAAVDQRSVREVTCLALDGTDTEDAAALVAGLAKTPRLSLGVRNLASEIERTAASRDLRSAVSHGIVAAWQLTSGAGAAAATQLVEHAGVEGARADILFLTGHAARHGALFYRRGERTRTLANPWSRDFRPRWQERPHWLIMGGCGVLGLRYTRLVRLSRDERTGLLERHRDIAGRHVAPPGLTDDHTAVYQVYHPGWAWYSRVFRTSALRGVLGYWYRAPGKDVGDVRIINAFVDAIRGGMPLVEAWRKANRTLPLTDRASAPWAAMIRAGCETDTLDTLEDAKLRKPHGEFRYFSVFHDGDSIASAYAKANTLDDSVRTPRVLLGLHSFYDGPMRKDDLPKLQEELDSRTLYRYDDGVGP